MFRGILYVLGVLDILKILEFSKGSGDCDSSTVLEVLKVLGYSECAEGLGDSVGSRWFSNLKVSWDSGDGSVR